MSHNYSLIKETENGLTDVNYKIKHHEFMLICSLCHHTVGAQQIQHAENVFKPGSVIPLSSLLLK